jgi:hypothetical protein
MVLNRVPFGSLEKFDLPRRIPHPLKIGDDSEK